MFHIFAARPASNSPRTGGKSRLIVGRISPPFLRLASGHQTHGELRQALATGPQLERAAPLNTPVPVGCLAQFV